MLCTAYQCILENARVYRLVFFHSAQTVVPSAIGSKSGVSPLGGLSSIFNPPSTNVQKDDKIKMGWNKDIDFLTKLSSEKHPKNYTENCVILRTLLFFCKIKLIEIIFGTNMTLGHFRHNTV